MPIQVLMPPLPRAMEEGALARWLVAPGDRVRVGDVIAEIESDTTTMEVEAVDEGIIGKILVPAGTRGIRVDTPIALLVIAGEGSPLAQPAAIPPPSTPQVSRIAASPLARRLAREWRLDLSGVAGSGPGGRIVKQDVERARAQTSAMTAAPTTPRTDVATRAPHGDAATAATRADEHAPERDERVLALYEPGSYEIVPHDTMRRVIAERLTHAKQTIPHFYLSIDCVIDDLIRARERLNVMSPRSGPRAYKLSVNDFVIKAMALALQQVPAANAIWLDGGIARHKYSDVGVAVAVDGGLYTPLVRHAELKSLSEISNEMKDLAERARARRLAPHDYQGGTTSISNLGMHGIKSFEAVINPPHATILAVGAAERRPVATADGVGIATIMSCTLSCDHRVVDGVVGAALLAAFKGFIEDPVRMLV